MKKVLYGLLLILAIASLLYRFIATDEGRETKKMIATYQAFNDANNQRDGERAATLVSRASLEYYASVLEMAKYDSESELLERGIFDVVSVIIARGTASTEQLSAMNSGAELLAHLVTVGSIPKGTTPELTPSQKKTLFFVSEDGKEGFLGSPEQKSKMRIFVKEEGQWRLDMGTLLLQKNTRNTTSRANWDAIAAQAPEQFPDSFTYSAAIWEAPLKR